MKTAIDSCFDFTSPCSYRACQWVWARADLRTAFTRGPTRRQGGVRKPWAAPHGSDAQQAETVWSHSLWQARLNRADDDAMAAGVFGTDVSGAPFPGVDGGPFRGNDRKPQIERRLARRPF